jgi:predicted phage terminase large subunit-like protein
MTSPIVSLEEYHAILRVDFCPFVERCFAYLNSETAFLRNWHIEVMGANLEAWRRGEISRLIVNVPPRHLKSLCASIALPAFILGHNPTAQIICVSYAQDLADKLARDRRSIMTSLWYQKVFRTRLSPQKQSVGEFVTTEQGYRLSTSVGGVLTGRGADYIIIDDPLKPTEALSAALRNAANEWYDSTLFSRLNNKSTGRIMLIMQRLHQDDLVGHVQAREGWKILSFPAIAERDEEFLIQTPYGDRRFTRKEGELLHPERESLGTLKQIRATVGEYNFAGQYQQAPAPLEGGLVKKAWLKYYLPSDLPAEFDQVIQSWDTANTPSELSDYSVCTTWGLRKKRIYLLDVYRKKVNYPDLKRAVKELARAHSATVVLIEDKASGTQLIQELVNNGLRIVKAVKPEGNKVMRFNAITATIDNGFVHLPKDAPWLPEYVSEITTFPGAKYDDQADSTSQALAWMNQIAPEPGFLEYVKFESGRMMYEQGASLEEAAESIDVTTEEFEDWINFDRNELIDEYNRIFKRLSNIRD